MVFLSSCGVMTLLGAWECRGWVSSGVRTVRSAMRLLAGPGARLLAERQAEAGAGGHQHAAIADLDAFVEQRLEPFEMLDPGLARVSRGEVDVQFHGEVRREHQARMLGLRGDLQE